MTKADETTEFLPKFDKNGLIAAIAQDHESKEVLMLAWMNEDALNETMETGEAYYWSRSRQELWHKGATSGAIQIVKKVIIDCDQDAVILFVEQKSTGACHTGRPSCFYRQIKNNELVFIDNE